MNNKSIYGYIRVSTQDQSEHFQRDALRKAGCTEISADIGVSGAKEARPALDALWRKLKAGDQLVVWKLDRLGRSLSHLVRLLNELRARQVHFRSISDGIDTDTPLGRLQFGLIATIAEYERELISERTKAGMAAAKARGVKLGRPKNKVDPGKAAK